MAIRAARCRFVAGSVMVTSGKRKTQSKPSGSKGARRMGRTEKTAKGRYIDVSDVQCRA